MTDRDYIRIPIAAIYDMSCPERGSEHVAWWAARIRRPASCTPNALVRFVREAGLEVKDDEGNWHTTLWLTACEARRESGGVDRISHCIRSLIVPRMAR